jgi:hypothetical protein
MLLLARPDGPLPLHARPCPSPTPLLAPRSRLGRVQGDAQGRAAHADLTPQLLPPNAPVLVARWVQLPPSSPSPGGAHGSQPPGSQQPWEARVYWNVTNVGGNGALELGSLALSMPMVSRPCRCVWCFVCV